MERSISFSRGKGKLTHNDRTFISPNVDPTRTQNNIIIVNRSLGEAYEEVFGKAQAAYNEKQKRKDRRIDDYFTKLFGVSADSSEATEVIRNDNKQQSFYEWVIGVGSAYDTALVNWQNSLGQQVSANPEAARLAAVCLTEYVTGDAGAGVPSYEERNPYLYLVKAIIHMDEKTPHIHLDAVPFADGYKTGMTRQQGIAKALAAMGYGTGETAIAKWQESERAVFRGICERHGLEIRDEEKSRGYTVLTQQFGEFHENEIAIKEQRERIAENDITIKDQKAKFDELKVQREREAAQQAVQATQAQARLEVMQEQAKSLQSRTEGLQSEIDSLTQNRDALQAEIDELEQKKTGVLRKLVNSFRAKPTLQAAEQLLDKSQEVQQALTEQVQKELEKTQQARKEAEESRDMAALYEDERAVAQRKADKLLKRAEKINSEAEAAYADRLDEAEDEIQRRIEQGIQQGIEKYEHDNRKRFAELDRRFENKQQALQRLESALVDKSTSLYAHGLYGIAKNNSDTVAERIKTMREKSQEGRNNGSRNSYTGR